MVLSARCPCFLKLRRCEAAQAPKKRKASAAAGAAAASSQASSGAHSGQPESKLLKARVVVASQLELQPVRHSIGSSSAVMEASGSDGGSGIGPLDGVAPEKWFLSPGCSSYQHPLSCVPRAGLLNFIGAVAVVNSGAVMRWWSRQVKTLPAMLAVYGGHSSRAPAASTAANQEPSNDTQRAILIGRRDDAGAGSLAAAVRAAIVLAIFQLFTVVPGACRLHCDAFDCSLC